MTAATNLTLNAARRAIANAPKIRFNRRRSPAEIHNDVERNFIASSAAGDALIPKPFSVTLRYCDRDKDLSDREVLVQGIFRFNQHNYISAYCFVRNECRSFRMDRIQLIRFRHLVAANPETVLSLVEKSAGLNNLVSNVNGTDFFVHPRTWGDYRRPMAVIRRMLSAYGQPSDAIFDALFHFSSESLLEGKWGGWYTPERAIGLCLLTERLDIDSLSWKDEAAAIKGGRFSRQVFNRIIQQFDA